MTTTTPAPGMRDYIRQEPEAIRRAQHEVPGDVAQLVGQLPFPVGRVELVGSGTSLHAGLAVRGEYESALGVEVRLSTPNEFCHTSHGRIGPGTLVVGISQTGRSTGTNDAIRLARQRGAYAVLVTGWADSAGSRVADAVLDIRCGEEHVGARTKGYVATVFALVQLGRALAGLAPVITPELPGTLADTVERAEAAAPAVADAFTGASAIWVVSYGAGMATAREGALKLIETVRIPVLAFDVEEYMHGPYHCLEPDTRLVFVAPPGPELARMRLLVRFAADVTRHTLMIGSPEEVAAGPAGHGFPVDDSLPRVLDPILYIPPLQCLAATLTERQGRQPGVSRYPDFHHRLGSKSSPDGGSGDTSNPRVQGAR